MVAALRIWAVWAGCIKHKKKPAPMSVGVGFVLLLQFVVLRLCTPAVFGGLHPGVFAVRAQGVDLSINQKSGIIY